MVDACLIVEGSYPYVTGGVSEWADGLIRSQPDLTFAVAHLREADGPVRPPAYALPENAQLVEIDLDGSRATPQAGAEDRLPEARVYHAACTGAAAELGRRVARDRGATLAVTEHGLAWREALWAPTGCNTKRTRPMGPPERLSRAAEVAAMARAAYAAADAVTSVCGPNHDRQTAAGAPRERQHLILNPVQPRAERAGSREGLLVGFVGRVVAIKDVATFLRACALVADRRDDARFVVVGPLEHEPDYAQRCVELADELGLRDRIQFTGTCDPSGWYERLDVLALTSLSEAQPLVALEAMAAGVPVVATDVGGCREAVGDGGLITPVRSPRATADAILRIGHDGDLAAALGRAGRRRTSLAHDPAQIHGAYRELYERLAA
jgi:glycosyltransferase involved in cell wall biosynthesis